MSDYHRVYYYSILITLCCIQIDNEDWTKSTQDIVWEATLEMLQILKFYDSRYGHTKQCIFLDHALLVTIKGLLSRNDDDVYSNDITQFCIFFRETSRRIPFAFAAFRMFQLSLKQSKRSLPPSTEKVFDEFFTSEWVNRELAELESHYQVVPTNTWNAEFDEAQNMTTFIAELDELHLEQSERDQEKRV